MSKINIKYKHDNTLYNCLGIKNNNKIVFKNELDNFNIEIFENKINILKTNKEGNINLLFEQNKETLSKYEIYELGTVYLTIKTNKLLIENNKIYIEYEIIESNDFHTYSLEYEVFK